MATVMDEMDANLKRIKAAGKQLAARKPSDIMKEEVLVFNSFGEKSFSLTFTDEKQFEAVKQALAPWYVFRAPRR